MPNVIELPLGTAFWSGTNKSFRKLDLEHRTSKSQCAGGWKKAEKE